MDTPPPPARKMPLAGRRSTTVSAESLIKTSYFRPDQTLPLIVEPAVAGVDLSEWAKHHQAWLNDQLWQHGGILLRGFPIVAVEQFEQFVTAVSSGALSYQERSSPRSLVSGRIYTSTDHPPSQHIYLHNEQSYNLTFPLKILFCCLAAAQQGGQTPIADSRRVFQHLPATVRARFLEQGYLYVRNFGDGFGLTWQVAFQTDDRAEVERYCRHNQIEFEWKEGDRLRTRQVRRVAGRHPHSGAPSWFNHATFFHVTSLEPEVSAMMQRVFAPEDLPNNTYYGDGSPIEPEVLDRLHAAYAQETVEFDWQNGDVLLLDNFLTAHGRNPFVGPRKVVVGMADPVHWEDIQPVTV